MVSIPPPGGRTVLPDIPLKLSNPRRPAEFRSLPVDHVRGPQLGLCGAFIAGLGPQSVHRRIFKPASGEGGMPRLRIFAALRLMTSWKLIGYTTAR